LTYGLIQIEKERLVALVHYDDVFHLVPKKALTAPLNMKKRIPELKLYQGIPLVMISEKTAIEYNQQSKNHHLPFCTQSKTINHLMLVAFLSLVLYTVTYPKKWLKNM